ncbi:MAG: metal-binding protein, partial [Erythrobacter sp.]|nr:metal-binding protein [Erythrobacter sp.]
MATQGTPLVPLGDADITADAAVQRPWRMRDAMSRFAGWIEGSLAASGFDRGPWLIVAFAAGIGSWFLLANPWQWIGAIALAALLSLSALSLWKGEEGRAHLRLAGTAIGLAFAVGLVVIWARSEVVGATPLPHPTMMKIDGRILERQEQPAEDRIRLVLATRDPE